MNTRILSVSDLRVCLSTSLLKLFVTVAIFFTASELSCGFWRCLFSSCCHLPKVTLLGRLIFSLGDGRTLSRRRPPLVCLVGGQRPDQVPFSLAPAPVFPGQQHSFTVSDGVAPLRIKNSRLVTLDKAAANGIIK